MKPDGITVKALNDENMKALGFVERAEKYWEFRYVLEDYISYMVIINRHSPEDYAILVMDELFQKPYCFARKYGTSQIAKDVDKVSIALQLVGVISGYTPGNPEVFSAPKPGNPKMFVTPLSI